MTYHFENLHELLAAAFRKLAEEVSDRFLELLVSAGSPAEAREDVVDIMMGSQWATPRNLLLVYELYAYASRNPEVQVIMRDWIGRSRHASEKHFDPLTARALDARIEGMTIHASVDPLPGGLDQVREIVRRLSC